MTWAGQPIDMIDPQSGNLAPFDQSEDRGMPCLKYLRLFHAQPYQIVDIKKSPIIDLPSGRSPMSETIR